MTTKTRPATRHEFELHALEEGYQFPLQSDAWARLAREVGFLPNEATPSPVSKAAAAAEETVAQCNARYVEARRRLVEAERIAGRDVALVQTMGGDRVVVEAPEEVSAAHERELVEARDEMRAAEVAHQTAVDNRIAVLAGEGPRRRRGIVRRALASTW